MAGEVLGDHKRFKKRFIPPMLASGMNIQFTHWRRGTLPEVLWIAVLHELFGYKVGTEAALALAEAAGLASGGSPPLPLFAFAGAYAGLTPEQRASILDQTSDNVALRTALRGAEPLVRLFPEYPLASLVDVPNADDEVSARIATDLLRVILFDLPDRGSKRALFTAGTVLYIAAMTGRLFFAEDVPVPNLNALMDYPDTEESKHTAAGVRASMPALLEFELDKTPTLSDWITSFWETALAIGECE